MRRLLLKLRRRRNLHDDLAEELAFHQDEARRHGNPTSLGSRVRITEESLDLWRLAWIEGSCVGGSPRTVSSRRRSAQARRTRGRSHCLTSSRSDAAGAQGTTARALEIW